MSAQRVCLAVDLGANSGRVLAGIYDGRLLEMRELVRFPNDPVKTADGWHWNMDALFASIQSGLAQAARQFGPALVSVGVDTWGVDYGLVDAGGQLLGAPFQYRDARTDGMREEAIRRMPAREIYRRTGIQFMFFNTIFQLLAEARSPARLLDKADRLLFIPDLVNFWLAGCRADEHSFASTSQLYDPRARDWDRELIAAMGLPARLFGPLTEAGTRLGPVRPELAAGTGAAGLQVIAPAEHDTASAVAGVPAEEAEPVFLSSGTWSVIGRELASPVISTPAKTPISPTKAASSARRAFSRTSRACGSCRNANAPGTPPEKAPATKLSSPKPPRPRLLPPGLIPTPPEFQAPANMPEALAAFCRRTGQTAPAETGRVHPHDPGKPRAEISPDQGTPGRR